MNHLQMAQIGEIIRKVRKERNLRLEDLADENISPATISNIERGVPHVHKKKMEYLMEKMDLQRDKLPQLMQSEERQAEEIRFYLLSAASFCDAGQTKWAWEMLEKISVDDHHELAASYYYMKGQCLLKEDKYKRAERAFQNAIRLGEENEENASSQMSALSHLGLAHIYSDKHQYEQALSFVEEGLKVLKQDEEQADTQFQLRYHKALYLEKMGSYRESLVILDQMWEEVLCLSYSRLQVGAYGLRARLQCQLGIYQEAEKTALHGLEKVRHSGDERAMFDLWKVMGDVYVAEKNWTKAEMCYLFLLSQKEKGEVTPVFVHVYLQMGLLYFQQKLWAKAHEMIDQGTNLALQLKDRRLEMKSYISKGDAFISEEKVSDAISYYEQALDLAGSLKDPTVEHELLFRLTHAWEKIDEGKFMDMLKQLYSSGLRFHHPLSHITSSSLESIQIRN
ncbi:helix-turn-helix domain-containing protein [Mechercharimyces sp. CAU 1602]|uniref:helix-turn-helix domain-containing protein n=1 Tax=Mechercharimyces sp. CAU 1602 TaxID=2973933 RepID=UPI002162CD31|nr:helix-turn-helix domain-containing protein [Mechercharimyces sp. CAU 1602]MCS1350081.1 hypothetical protein [Mechercharimyces sp. CAU 1602]